jgi:hypothetical protein
MKNIFIIMVMCLTTALYSQQLSDRNNLGLKVSTTGASLFMVGISMKSTAIKQYTPHHGYNFTSMGISPSQRKTQVNTLIIGGVITLAGIIIQNLKNRKNEKNINTLISSN